MRTVALGEIGTIVSGATPKTGVAKYWNGQIPWVTPADLSDHDGIYYRGKPKRITQAGFESCSATMLPSNSILFSSRAPIGHCALSAIPVCTNQGFKNIVPTDRLDPLYGYFALKFVTPDIIAKGRGATFGEVTKEIMEEVRVPYCDLPEQKRIARLLEQADRLRRSRRYALELSDTFLPAAFLELFGDPKAADFRYEKIALEELCTKVTDGTHHTPTYIGQGVPFLSVKNVNTLSGQLDFKNTKFISLAAHKELIKRCKPERNDVLYTKVGATFGIPKLVDTDVEFSIFVSLALLKPNKSRIVPRYFESVLKSDFVTEQARRLVSGIAVPDLHLREIKTFQIPTPSLDEQQRFADLAEACEHLDACHREALRQANHLFESLLDQCFAAQS